MEYSFPHPVRVKTAVQKIDGLRLSPFTNVDGETFGKPTLNGYWRVSMSILSIDVQGHLALSAFTTAMSQAGATCVVPICTQWRPNDARGRPLQGIRNNVVPLFTFDHLGFQMAPFDGFTLEAPARHRDSFLDIARPALSQLWPGHYVTLGDKLHQVVAVSAIAEDPTRIRASVVPNIRGDHDAGTVVVVDHLRLRCRLEEGDQIGAELSPKREASLTFIEAF